VQWLLQLAFAADPEVRLAAGAESRGRRAGFGLVRATSMISV